MKDKKTFGSFIKEKRISKNYSQKDLADLLFVTESAISKWERGVTYPDITLISDICRVLDVSEKELIQSSDDYEYRKMKHDSEKFNKIKKSLFWTFNICYLLALLVCFIVNIAVNHTVSWFFIVLTSILVAYSFCPTFTWVYTKFKKLIFIGSTVISLFILFLTCSIYTDNYWFMIATLGVLLGYFIIFYPLLFIEQKKYLNEDKYNRLSKYFLLSYMVGILVLIILLLLSIYIYNPFNLLSGIIISSALLAIPIIFGLLNLINKKRIVKVFSISLVCIVVITSLASVINAFYINSKDEIKSYIIKETYNKVIIDTDTEDINIYLVDEESKINYTYNKYYNLDVEVIDSTLYIKRIDNRPFYNKIFSFSNYKMDIYLSDTMIESLDIELSTGDVNIYEGLCFNSVDIENSTGDINIKDIDNLGDVDIETSTGDINITNSKLTSLDIKISTGNTKLINVLIENNFNMEGSTGDLYFEGFDAKNIYVELSTGDVKGTILTSKDFDANSDTGRVSVPKTREGGDCIINVSTGDIIISYK